METVLIPTDFSEVSKNAAAYGIMLAKEKNVKLIFLHIFNIPVIAGDEPVFIPSYDELEKDNISFLKNFENEIRTKYNFTQPIENITKAGFLIDEITDIAAEKNASLIIMGISEAGKLSELLLSSSSIGVIKNTKCPTLVVPEGVSYKPINTIVFACDDLENIKDTLALKQITKFVEFFNSKLIVLNVVESFENLDFKKNLLEAKNKTIFEKVNYTVHFIQGDNLVSNINNFMDENNGDLLIMIPKKHNVFSQLIHESSTKKMAFHSHVPVLAIHE